MNERIADNVKILYALGFYIMDGKHPRTQYNAVNKIVDVFEKSVPCPVSIYYMFENTMDDEYIMVEFTKDGYCLMRIPTSKEINEYLEYQLSLN